MARVKKTDVESGDGEGKEALIIKVPKIKFTTFSIWIVGDTPLITHAWSKKAKDEMYQKQVAGRRVSMKEREPKNPDKEFVDSLYDLGDGTYGFPITGVKKCLLSAAHKDKGIPRDGVMRSLWLDAEMHRVRPAHAGAICDMPLARIYGDAPVMREDMVKIGSGLNKTAAFAYRGQFTKWAMRLSGRYDANVLTLEAIGYLIVSSGLSAGLGEWRNERHGMFGAFHLADDAETAEWTKFAARASIKAVPSTRKAA